MLDAIRSISTNNVKMKKIEIECKACKGTGLYQGMAERDKCAVVCHTCKGTGKDTFTYNKFTGRKVREDIERVFAGSFGYVHTHKDVIVDGRSVNFTEGGCTYQEWLNGKKPEPVKDLYCPYFWDREELSKCNLFAGDKINECPHYEDKSECWEEWEKKND